MNSAFIVPGGFSKLKPEIDKLKMTYLEMSSTEEFGVSVSFPASPLRGVAAPERRVLPHEPRTSGASSRTM